LSALQERIRTCVRDSTEFIPDELVDVTYGDLAIQEGGEAS